MADTPIDDDGVVGPHLERPKRRTFSAEYKLKVVLDYDPAGADEKGALLRREGFHSSHMVEWRGPATRAHWRAGGAAARFWLVE